MLYSVIISALISAAVFFYFALSLIQTVILCIAIFLCLTLLSKSGILQHLTEGFDASEIDDSRYIHYGDTVLIWTNTNTFMRMNQGKYIDNSSRLPNPDEVPRAWVWEFFTIEDSRDPRWQVGSRNSVKYGDKVFLRSWLPYNSNSSWVRPNTDLTIGGSDRHPQCALTVERADTTGNASTYVTYGDPIYFKTFNNMYISQSAKYIQVSADKRNQSSIFRIYDNYGQGTIVDWATRGFATQSSLYGSYDATNVLDGNPLTFNHTNIESNAWWQVELPRDIHIDSIVILNRKDCCQSRIADFDVTVLDNKGTPVYSKNIKETNDVYTLSGVNRNGRIVKIQLRGKNYLHIASLKVYGAPVQYSTIVDTPVVADLISTETTIKSNDKLSFHSSTVPLIGKNNSISISLCCKPESVDTKTILLYKGENLYVTVESGLLSVNLATTKGKVHKLSTGRIKAREWNHIGLVLKSQISPKTGWLYGEFSEPKPAGTPSSCCFVVNINRQEYYYVKSQGLFAEAKKNTWTASYVDGMKYMGELTTSDATLTIYINGEPDVTHNIEGYVELTNEEIVIGQVVIKQQDSDTPTKDNKDLPLKGFTGIINMFRFYNYDVSSHVIQRDSQFLYNALTLDLSRGTVDANTEKIIGAHLLPSIGQEVSVSFWLYSSRTTTGTGKADRIFWKGSKTPDSLPYLAFMPNSNNLNVSIVATEEVKGIASNTWTHVAQVINGDVHTVYINGKLALTTNVASPKTSYASGAIHIGGFNGKIKDMRYHNFSLSEDEIHDNMGMSPDYKQRETIAKIWKSLGCTTDLFNIGNDTENNTLISLMKSDQNKLEAELRQYKNSADKGDIKLITKCYGSKASTLTAQLNKSSKLLTHSVNGQQELSKKCLPIAPFECTTSNVNNYDIRTHKDFYKYTKTDQIRPPGDLNIELAATKKALEDMKALRQQSEKQNQLLQDKIQQQGNTKALQNKLLRGQSVLLNISEQEELLKSTPLGSPADVQHARQLAAVNLTKGMDLETLRKTPLFQEVLKEVMNRTNGNIAEDEDISALRQDLQLKKQALESLQKQTTKQLINTKTLANDVFNGIPGLDSTMINNIIDSKQELSTQKHYQETLDKIKTYSKNQDISEHPEYQNLVTKLNQLTTDQVAAKGETYQDFKMQASKCSAMFEKGTVSISNDAMLKTFSDKVKSDPAFKALFKNIIQSTAQQDGDLSDILKKAENDKYMNDPAFQDFLLKITKAQIQKNPLYRKMLVSLMGTESLNNIRIEDHPEYNRYADDMRKTCKI